MIQFCCFLVALSGVSALQWRTVWRENFDGPAGSQPSRSVWKYDVGTSYVGGPQNWGTGEIQTYTDKVDNIRLDGRGNLLITPLRDSSGNWTSARIETLRDDFRPASNGIMAIEARIQMPNVTGVKARGYWPAFWALGAPLRLNYSSWPMVGEFDILENVNGLNQLWGTLHCGVSPGGPCQETNGLGSIVPCPGESCQSAFHTFRFEWDDNWKEFRWYINGMHYHTVTKDQIGPVPWSEITRHGYFILANVAVGGGFPDGVANMTTPTSDTEPGHPMLIDYVAVYASCFPRFKYNFYY